MEIEFNPGRSNVPGASQPAARRVSATPTETQPHERVQALEQALRDAPKVRPEMVERGRALVSNVAYPPEEVLDRIATLLAVNTEA